MKKIVEHLPIFTICLIYLGFCNLYFYFKEFKIDIFNFINSSEILLSFLPTIVLIAGLFYSSLVSFAISDTSSIVKTNSEMKNDSQENKPISFWKRFLKSPVLYLVIYFILFYGVRFFLLRVNLFKEYELQDFQLISSMIFIVILLITIFSSMGGSYISKYQIAFSFFFLMYIGEQFHSYRRFDALKVKDGISNTEVVFKYNNKIVSTNKNLIFIGQTQSNLFIWNRKDLTTLIYKTSNIDSLIIK